MRKTLSIVVPAYNEERSLEALHARLSAVLSGLPYDREIVMVDDGSSDGTAAAISALATGDSGVRLIEFSRNFGKEAATSAGIIEAKGDAVIIIDADLEHPPELIPTLVAKWEEGFDVVVGVRRPRKSEGWFRRLGSRGFAKLMNSIAKVQAPPGATDFRLIDRAVADEFAKLSEHKRLTRSLIDWLGFKRAYVDFDAGDRGAKGRYGFGSLFDSAFSAIIAHSRLPLFLAGYLGVLITLFAGALGLLILIEQVLLRDPWGLDFTGPAMLAILILFLNGIVLVSLGLMALYVGTIHQESTGRPLYVIRKRS